jgi:syntaxin 8
MSPPTSRLTLLSDQTRISIEERNRLRELGLKPSEYEDAEIVHSLKTLRLGIEEVSQQGTSSNIDRLVSSYSQLLELYRKDPDVVIDSSLVYVPSEPESIELGSPKTATSTKPKSVRFKETLVDDMPEPRSTAYEETFIQPYKDDPEQTEEVPVSASELYQRQQQMMREQDSHLDMLAKSVSRQHELSIQIDEELDSHLELLDDVDRVTDRSHSRLNSAKKRLDVFSRKARENGSIVTIAILIITLVILMVVLT